MLDMSHAQCCFQHCNRSNSKSAAAEQTPHGPTEQIQGQRASIPAQEFLDWDWTELCYRNILGKVLFSGNWRVLLLLSIWNSEMDKKKKNSTRISFACLCLCLVQPHTLLLFLLTDKLLNHQLPWQLFSSVRRFLTSHDDVTTHNSHPALSVHV